MSLPYFKVKETSTTTFAGGSGGKRICVIGKTPQEAETGKIYEFGSYPDANKDVDAGGLGEESESNELLAAIKDIFEEGSGKSPLLGIEKIYAINVGSSPTITEWTAAQETTRVRRDIQIEDYVGNSDLAFMNTTKTHLASAFLAGGYRRAVFTHAADATVEEIADMTNPANANETPAAPYIMDSRLDIKYDRSMQHKYVAKLATTPYDTDPGYGAYRTVTMDDITLLDDDDMELLTAAGIVVDWEHNSPIGNSGLVEPARVVATSFRAIAGAEQPADANAHIRFNVDYHWKNIDNIVSAGIKANDTETGLTKLEKSCQMYLKQEKEKGSIVDYSLSIEPDPEDIYACIVRRMVQPVNAIYGITEDSKITPPGGSAIINPASSPA